MNQCSMIAGLDLADKHSYLCPIDAKSGKVLKESSRLSTSPRTFEERFSGREPMCIAVETGTHSPWVSQLSERCRTRYW